MEISAPDLTQRPPRSPRVRLGGYVMLPRLLDKGRAALAGRHGEYHYNCPLDQHFFTFCGIDPEALQAELAKGKGDHDMLEWIIANARAKHSMPEILAWSAYHVERVPTDLESREFFNTYHAQLAPHRTDIMNWFDILDVDDHVTFGGKA